MITEIKINTQGQGLYEFTDKVKGMMANKQGDGLLNLYVKHTSCSLVIQENADPDVVVDLKNFFSRLVPPASHSSMSYITHIAEGDDDMPAHIKSALLPTSISIPVVKGKIQLGTWQGIYLFEHRDHRQCRTVVISVING